MTTVPSLSNVSESHLVARLQTEPIADLPRYLNLSLDRHRCRIRHPTSDIRHPGITKATSAMLDARRVNAEGRTTS